MKLSVIVPAFNERGTVAAIVDRVLRVDQVGEVLLVDDASTDGTREILAGLAAAHPETVRYHAHPVNLGKGAAVRAALAMATGEVVIVQDADAEYHPEDYPAALRLIEGGWADAVYGSRFLGPHRVFLLWHYVGNRILTAIANVLTSGILTDMETGFKMVRTSVLRDLDLRSSSFDLEVEVTLKLFRRGYRVYEIPITYTGRDYAEGKKITWRDGFRALWALAKWGLLARRRP